LTVVFRHNRIRRSIRSPSKKKSEMKKGGGTFCKNGTKAQKWVRKDEEGGTASANVDGANKSWVGPVHRPKPWGIEPEKLGRRTESAAPNWSNREKVLKEIPDTTVAGNK